MLFDFEIMFMILEKKNTFHLLQLPLKMTTPRGKQCL